jgi:hypothetical protein
MQTPLNGQRANRLLLYGILWHLVGCGPLYYVTLRSKMGIGDPNPNPVLFGIMAGVSFLPSLIVIAFGIYLKWKRNSA